MRRYLHESVLLAVAVLLTVPVSGQDRTVWRTAADIREGITGVVVGTAVDVDEARRQVQIAADDDRYGRITVVTDALSTQYNGFGGVINDSPEIFVGSRGFSNLRVGDRLEVHGAGRGGGLLRADQVTLLGRSVSASQTGVGSTRSPTSVSTPTVGTRASATVYGRVEGVVRQVNASDNRIVVETDRREIFNIRASASTPVRYRGDTYQVSNLEVGDRVRVESDGSSTTDREIRATSIEVLESVQEGGSSPTTRVSSITGRVTRVDRAADTIRVGTARGEVRVDMSRAYDASGRRTRAADLQIGDRVDISGSYGSNSELFSATTVRMNEDVFSPAPAEPQTRGNEPTGGISADLVTVSISGTVTESLENAPALSLRDRTSGRTIALYVIEDFAVKTKTGGYTTADRLKVNDNVLVKAYRDGDGNLIAQTIRIR